MKWWRRRRRRLLNDGDGRRYDVARFWDDRRRFRDDRGRDSGVIRKLDALSLHRHSSHLTRESALHRLGTGGPTGARHNADRHTTDDSLNLGQGGIHAGDALAVDGQHHVADLEATAYGEAAFDELVNPDSAAIF